jgi:hypothetical protein
VRDIGFNLRGLMSSSLFPVGSKKVQGVYSYWAA